MTKDIKLSEIKNLVDECIKNNKIDFLSNLIFTLQKNYTELAELSTEGNYNEGWSHDKVLDYVTYESR
jgi:hypothetical protein